MNLVSDIQPLPAVVLGYIHQSYTLIAISLDQFDYFPVQFRDIGIFGQFPGRNHLSNKDDCIRIDLADFPYD